MTVAAMPPVAAEVTVNSTLWQAQPRAADTVRQAITAAARLAPGDGDVAVLLTDDASVRAMNARWRGLDKTTNVLSFPAAAGAAPGAHLGDIAIAFETVEREAVAERKPLLDHLAHLAIHGYLHLVGFDHETERDAEKMETLEQAILSKLGIANPYAERNAD